MLEAIVWVAIIAFLCFWVCGLSRIKPRDDSDPTYGAD